MGEHQGVWIWMADQLSEAQAYALTRAVVRYRIGGNDTRFWNGNEVRTAWALTRMGLLKYIDSDTRRPTPAGEKVALRLAL